MRLHLSTAALFAALFAGAAGAQDYAPKPPPPPEIFTASRCVWARMTTGEKAPVLGAVGTFDFSAGDVMINRVMQRAVVLAGNCAPSLKRDVHTATRVLAPGLRQEATADLLARDLGLTREALDAAVAAAPSTLTDALANAAGPSALRSHGPSPSFVPLFTALGQPAAMDPSDSHPAYLISSYALETFQIRAAAAGYDPDRK